MDNQGPLRMEELRVLQSAEMFADSVWDIVKGWKAFERDTIGKQLVRASDSVGANIAEAFGRFYYGEKLRFLYYARGSLFETKYWLNRAKERKLLNEEQFTVLRTRIKEVVRQLNAFANVVKRQRHRADETSYSIREPYAEYTADSSELLTPVDIEYLVSDT